MVINVTQAHIDAGVPNLCFECMLARALEPILDASPTVIDWAITRNSVYIDDGTIPHYIKLPDNAYKNALLFDIGNRNEVQPFSFELPIDELFNGG